MKRIARIVVVLVLLLISVAKPVLSQGEKNEYEREWEKLHQKVYSITSAEEAYDYALKHLGIGHPSTDISKKRLLKLYLTHELYRKYLLVDKIGWETSQLLINEKENQYTKQWEELYFKGRKFYKSGEHHQVIIAAEQAYAYALKYLGPEHPGTLVSIEELLFLYHNYKRYSDEEPLYKRAIQLQEKLLGRENRHTLLYKDMLVLLYNGLGRKNQAEILCKQVLQLRKKYLGEEHTDTLSSIEHLAMLYSSQGRKREAEALFKESLHGYKRLKGLYSQSGNAYITSINLIELYLSQNRYTEAEQLLKELSEELMNKGTWSQILTKKAAIGIADQIWEAKIELATVYQLQRKFDKAEYLLKEIIKWSEEYFDTDPEGITLKERSMLANMYIDQKRYSEAESIANGMIIALEKYSGNEDKHTVKLLSYIANIYKLQEKYNEAESLYKEAIKLSEKIFGVNNPITLSSLEGYILLLVSTNRSHVALPLVQEWENRLLSRSFQELYTSSNHNVRRLYEQTVNFFLNTVSSLAVQQPEETYQHYAANVMLRWKQLYAEEESFQHQQLARSDAPEIVKLRNNLAEARIKLSQALLQKKNEEELARLMDDVNEAEITLLAETKRFKSHLEAEKATLDKVALPQGSGLIEYRRFRPVDFKAGKAGELHLGALLLLADPKAKQRFIFHDLGPLAEIEKHLKEETAEAYKRLLGPFDDQIKNLKQIYIAPDGPLNLLSFASLRLPDGRFLAERQQINQLQTGRDVLTDNSGVSGKGLVAIGGAKYGPTPAGKAESATMLAAAYQQRAARELAQGIPYLPESRREAENIGGLFAKKTGETPTVLIGEDASEHSLKQLRQPPRILHLSTHGFYLAQDEKSKLADEAPLLLSGLALANANSGLQGKLDQHGDDGLLYSLEVLGLNLHGTELVSLSACETGKGVPDYSEGVYGLVRAFRTAGAKSVLMTLTPVDDKPTRDFMETFYDKWLSSEKSISPAEALHQTRLQFIRDKKPTKDWAPFVLVGK